MADYFVEWVQKQGYKVVQTQHASWYNHGPGVYQAFPYFALITPSAAEINAFFHQTHAIAIRYSTTLDQPVGKISYHVVREQPLTVQELTKKVRHDVQHGFEYARYQQITWERLAQEGWNIRYQTLERQGRTSAESKKSWQQLCCAAQGLNGFETWGAIYEDHLVAAVVCAIVDGICQILYHQSASEHMKHGINAALIYQVTNEMFNRPGIRQVFYGLQSLDAPASVDEFKLRIGFEARPVRQRTIFNPLIAGLVKPFTYRLLQRALSLKPGSTTLAKAEGFFRFYLEGNLPPEQQAWPEILQDQRETILQFLKQPGG